MRILAIDPGPNESAFVVFEQGRILDKGKVPNDELLAQISKNFPADVCVIEMIASYGMAVGAEVFETCVWIGRYVESWTFGSGVQRLTVRLYRKEVKLHICGNSRANDANIRQALIDRFGGSDAIGKKASPGPLYGVSGDVWAALAVAVTYEDLYVKTGAQYASGA